MNIHQLTAQTIDGKEQSLGDYKGKVPVPSAAKNAPRGGELG